MSKAHPVHADHSIQEVVFVFHFSTNHTEEEIRQVLDECILLQDRYGKIERAQKYKVQIPGDGYSPQPPGEPELGGLRYFNKEPDGEEPRWIVRFEKDFLSVNILSYDRWTNVWGEAKQDLEAVARIILSPSKPIIGITLQYIDLFLDKEF
ncbi:MAG: TIGR04255 family protein, partial [Thiohalospira sp.]